MVSHATEHPHSTADHLETRYFASASTLNPAHRPEMRAVVCILLAKAIISDKELRAFIEEHIETDVVPQVNWEFCETNNFALPTLVTIMPKLCEQLLDYCSRPDAAVFEQPLLDGAGNMVGFLLLQPSQWQHTLDVTQKLGERMRPDMAAQAPRADTSNPTT